MLRSILIIFASLSVFTSAFAAEEVQLPNAIKAQLGFPDTALIRAQRFLLNPRMPEVDFNLYISASVDSGLPQWLILSTDTDLIWMQIRSGDRKIFRGKLCRFDGVSRIYITTLYKLNGKWRQSDMRAMQDNPQGGDESILRYSSDDNIDDDFNDTRVAARWTIYDEPDDGEVGPPFSCDLPESHPIPEGTPLFRNRL